MINKSKGWFSEPAIGLQRPFGWDWHSWLMCCWTFIVIIVLGRWTQEKKYFFFEKRNCGIESMLCHHLKYPYLWKQSPYSLTCLLWILLWHLGKIMNFNEWLYMLCVSDCIIASVGSIKSKDCLCIVAAINVTHSFFKMCIWFQKRSVLWHHI